jgi:DNA-nicking Smr family endonuclease
MRPLSPDEQQLWARVAATIRPLSRKPIEAEAEAQPPTPPPPQRPRGRVPPLRPAPPPPPARPGTLDRDGLDGHWDRRLKGGSVSPDRVIDLHGHSLDRAWDAIDSGLERAIGAGERVVLLITGHARPGDPPVERGKIRASVHDWLAASRHAGRIAAVRQAHRRHGGGGSLYLILRR